MLLWCFWFKYRLIKLNLITVGKFYFKGPGKRGHIVADTLLPTQMFPRLPARATFVADTNLIRGTKNASSFARALRRLERVFSCRSGCETMEDYKEGHLMVWTNYMSPCSSIAGIYFEGTCDVISVIVY